MPSIDSRSDIRSKLIPAAPEAVFAAMSDPAQQEWLNAVYDAVYDQHIDYYEDSIDLLCMMVMSGNFWSP